MRAFVKPPRKDGKYPVTYAYSNGVRLSKLRTAEQIERDIIDGYEVTGYVKVTAMGTFIHTPK